MPAQSNDASAGVFSRLTVDRSTPVPLYFQLAQQIETAILDGRLTPGMRVETELDLAERLGMSRPTVRHAMEYLVEKGVIVRQRGAGTRVVSNRMRRPLELSSLYDDLLRSGKTPTTRVISNRTGPASPDISGALQISPGESVIEIVRLRGAMGQPIARLTNYLPQATGAMSSEALEERGLYAIMRERGVRLHSANQAIGARNATAAEARLLDERRNAALLTMQRTTHDQRGAVVEYATHIYVASRYSFELSLLTG
ncbi:GntR family transcriptional regulator [Jatrophihabitans sp. GAS493]|uniref:GntR family transcriptional regulator n=1 Tax=Jatrophihabitans sp. GAS493 TaxID=1907575 RepID=UPI000BB7DAA1|nr:GntR family transcriptional regulator [Jatrophihabitans sp. GAS493]SOD73702.1 GntR family transcriptional regulator [Jatrophihabitans sp. GAS493]